MNMSFLFYGFFLVFLCFHDNNYLDEGEWNFKPDLSFSPLVILDEHLKNNILVIWISLGKSFNTLIECQFLKIFFIFNFV